MELFREVVRVLESVQGEITMTPRCLNLELTDRGVRVRPIHGADYWKARYESARRDVEALRIQVSKLRELIKDARAGGM